MIVNEDTDSQLAYLILLGLNETVKIVSNGRFVIEGDNTAFIISTDEAQILILKLVKDAAWTTLNL